MLTLHRHAVERILDIEGAECAPTPVRDIEGTLPSLPDGTWYLNGPGPRSSGHWLDGDGLVRALTFDAGAITFASRFVRTRKFCEEQGAQRALFRTFGTAFDGDRLNDWQTALEGPANVSLIDYGPGLLALGEQGQPWVVDPTTLDTIGVYTAHGALTPVTPFAAHAKVDPRTGELFNFGVSFSPARPELHFFRFDADGRQIRRTRIPLPAACAIHDFALGPSCAVFYVSPYVLDVARLRDGASVMAALEWRPRLGSRLLVVSRTTGQRICDIPIDTGYCLHTIDCREIDGQNAGQNAGRNDGQSDGHVIFDVIEMPSPIYDAYALPRLFERPVRAEPVRFRIDPVHARIESRRVLSERYAPEFPAIPAIPATASAGLVPTQPCQTFWALGFSSPRSSQPKFFDCLLRYSWEEHEACDVYRARDGMFLGGEPLVLDTNGRTLVLCQQFDTVSGRGGFGVFDGDDLRRGPLAQLWLDVPTPMAFHGQFVAARAKRDDCGARA